MHVYKKQTQKQSLLNLPAVTDAKTYAKPKGLDRVLQPVTHALLSCMLSLSSYVQVNVLIEASGVLEGILGVLGYQLGTQTCICQQSGFWL